jgi:recombinational DNA repair protein RecT
MKRVSTRTAAKKLGIHPDTLAHYVAVGKVPTPTIIDVGTMKLHTWTEEEIENVRKLLPKIANGRKTRWQRQRAAEKKKQKEQSAQPRTAVPHESRLPKQEGTKKKRPRRTD